MKTLLLLLSIAISLQATLSHVELDIYSNKSFLNKTYKLDQNKTIETKVPIKITLADIRYETDKECKIDSNDLSGIKKEVNPNLKKLRENRIKKNHEYEALMSKDVLLKSLSLSGVDDLLKIEEISSYLTKNMVENLTLIDNIKKEIEEIDKKIEEKNKIQEEFKILTTVYTCTKNNKNLKISYPLNSIKYTPFYDISANINNKSLIIEKKAILFYEGTQEHEHVDINIYSYRYNKNVAPQQYYPKYIGQEKKPQLRKMGVAMSSTTKSTKSIGKSKHKELDTKSLYKIEQVKLKSGEKNFLHVDKEVLDASFKIIIDTYGTNKAYLEAVFKSKKSYSPARANYFLNKNIISSNYIEKIEKNKKTKLYFGEDEHIQIEKVLIKTLDQKTFFGDKNISTQNWKYTLTNKKPYTTNIEFIARVPVSKNSDIEVKTLAQPKFDKQNAEGKTIWNFKLDADEKKEIIFGYDISSSK